MKNLQLILQEQTIEAVKTILLKYPGVIFAGVRGSFVDQTNTAFSDIDLTIFFDSDSRNGLDSIYQEILNIKPVLTSLKLLFDKESLVLFEDGVRLDITFLKQKDQTNLSADEYLILIDKNSVINSSKNSSDTKSQFKLKWNPQEGKYEEWFFWMFRQAYCYALQSTHISEKSFRKLNAAIVSIGEIREKYFQTLQYLHNDWDYLNNSNQELKNLFFDTYPRFNVPEVLYAIRQLIQIYEIIMKEYCQHETIDYPKDKVKIIQQLFDEFDSYV